MSKNIRVENTRVYELMGEWGDWVRQPTTGGHGGGSSILGQALSGMPSTRCPRCAGNGRRPAADYKTTKHYEVCDLCAGKGKIKAESTVDKINPAFIRSTSPGYDKSDAKFDFIKAMFDELPSLKKQVIIIEFLQTPRLPTKQERAAQVFLDNHRLRKFVKAAKQGKRGVSVRTYTDQLRMALASFEYALIERGWLLIRQLSRPKQNEPETFTLRIS